MADIKINSEKILSNNKFPLKLYGFEKPGLNGKPHSQENEIYFRPDGATVLLVDGAEQKMLFTRQVRLATFLNGNGTGYMVETCAGTIDEGETPEQAMEREITEETGYRATAIKKVMEGYPSPAGNSELIHFFIGRYDSKGPKQKGGGAKGEGEDIELIEMGIEEAKEKLAAGWFIDLKTVLLLQHYFLLGDKR